MKAICQYKSAGGKQLANSCGIRQVQIPVANASVFLKNSKKVKKIEKKLKKG